MFLQALFSESHGEGPEKIIATSQTAIYGDFDEGLSGKPHTLEEYSYEHFMPPPKRTLSKALQSSNRRRDKNVPWMFQKVKPTQIRTEFLKSSSSIFHAKHYGSCGHGALLAFHGKVLNTASN